MFRLNGTEPHHFGWRDALWVASSCRHGREITIVNTDQGSEFTSKAWTDMVEAAGARISMDGKGRWIDNVFIERLWRSVKYEDIYLRAYENGRDLQAGLSRYFDFYNLRRIHRSHDYRTPDEIYYAANANEPLAISAKKNSGASAASGVRLRLRPERQQKIRDETLTRNASQGLLNQQSFGFRNEAGRRDRKKALYAIQTYLLEHPGYIGPLATEADGRPHGLDNVTLHRGMLPTVLK